MAGGVGMVVVGVVVELGVTPAFEDAGTVNKATGAPATAKGETAV